MYFVYVLRSQLDGKFYTGFTSDIIRRVEEHNSGKVISTCSRSPFDLVYYEFCTDQSDAIHREKYLKTTYGKRYIKQRIKNYLSHHWKYFTGQAWARRRYGKSFISKLTDSLGEEFETALWNKFVKNHYYRSKKSSQRKQFSSNIEYFTGWLDYSKDCKYLSEEIHNQLINEYEEVRKILISMINNSDKWCV